MSNHAELISPMDRLVHQILPSLLLFASGFAALIYESSWSRLVGHVLGHTAEATAIVLAAFFAGMALGQWLQSTAHLGNPLLAFGVAECIVAGCAIAVPSLLDCVREFSGIPVWRTLGCFVILLPPSAAMGYSLPAMIAHVRIRNQSTAIALYRANTMGGLTGIAAAASVVLIFIGVRSSTYLAAALSITCGLLAFAACIPSPRIHGDSSNFPFRHRGMNWCWIAGAAISGFCVMFLEVLYTRLFALIFHNSIYTFGLVLSVCLLSLLLGTCIAERIRRLAKSHRAVLAVAMLASAGGVALSLTLFRNVSGMNYFLAGKSFGSYLIACWALISFIVVPPLACLGIVFPMTLQAATRHRRQGIVAAANTFAGAAGALCAGIATPWSPGLWTSFGVVIVVTGLAGAVLLWLASLRISAIASSIVICLLLYSVRATSIPAASGTDLVRRWESSYGWIDVVRNRESGALQLRQNLHYQHGSTATVLREYRQGRLPLLLHPNPTEVAFLGLGTGHTAAPSVTDSLVHRATIVELIPEVVEAARMLNATNRDVVDHPKVDVSVDDAANFLNRTHRRFDVIVSDLYVPWESRAAYLYSTDFYRLVRHRLKRGGLFCQWIALYQLGDAECRLIANSFASVFPNTTLWWGQLDSRYPIVAMIGTEDTIETDENQIDQRMNCQEKLPRAWDPDLSCPQDLFDLFLGRWEADQDSSTNSDEHPWIEMKSPQSHRDGTLLHGERLERFFDQALAILPSSGIVLRQAEQAWKEDRHRRISSQRLSLFGE